MESLWRVHIALRETVPRCDRRLWDGNAPKVWSGVITPPPAGGTRKHKNKKRKNVLDMGNKNKLQATIDFNIYVEHISFYTQKVALNTRPNTPINIPKTESLLKRLVMMGEKGLSATTLSNYIADPIRFYNNSVLRISETEELEESMTYQSLGTAIHNALEELYEPYVGNQLTVDGLEKMQKDHKKVLMKHFEKKLGIFRKNKVDNAKKMSAVCKDLTNLKSLKNPEINLTEASEDSDFNICFNMGILLDLNSFWTKFVLALVYFEDTMSTLIKTRFGSIEVKR